MMLRAQLLQDCKETCMPFCKMNIVRAMNMKYTSVSVYDKYTLCDCVTRPVRPLVLIYNSMARPHFHRAAEAKHIAKQFSARRKKSLKVHVTRAQLQKACKHKSLLGQIRLPARIPYNYYYCDWYSTHFLVA